MPAASSRKPDASSASINWPRMLVWFVRCMAVIWFVKGLMSWALILGIEPGAMRPFEARATTFQAVTIFFAVTDIVASVGLWLLAPWGGVVWLVAAIARIVLSFAVPASIGLTYLGAGAVGLAVVAFVLLTWLAGRQREET